MSSMLPHPKTPRSTSISTASPKLVEPEILEYLKGLYDGELTTRPGFLSRRTKRFRGDENDDGAQDVIVAQLQPDNWALYATLDGRRLKYVAKPNGQRELELYDLSGDPGGHRVHR